MIFTPDSWLNFCWCVGMVGHEWSDWYHVERQERKECGHCGIERKKVEPLVP